MGHEIPEMRIYLSISSTAQICNFNRAVAEKIKIYK